MQNITQSFFNTVGYFDSITNIFFDIAFFQKIFNIYSIYYFLIVTLSVFIICRRKNYIKYHNYVSLFLKLLFVVLATKLLPFNDFYFYNEKYYMLIMYYMIFLIVDCGLFLTIAIINSKKILVKLLLACYLSAFMLLDIVDDSNIVTFKLIYIISIFDAIIKIYLFIKKYKFVPKIDFYKIKSVVIILYFLYNVYKFILGFNYTSPFNMNHFKHFAKYNITLFYVSLMSLIDLIHRLCINTN